MSRHYLGCSAAAFVLLIAAGSVSAQSLPEFRLDAFPAVSRGAIARALGDVRAHPDDPALVGRLGMVLQAWQQWQAADAAYARARALERRFDWYYLGGVVASRMANHAEAAALFREAVALSPSSTPARLKL